MGHILSLGFKKQNHAGVYRFSAGASKLLRTCHLLSGQLLLSTSVRKPASRDFNIIIFHQSLKTPNFLLGVQEEYIKEFRACHCSVGRRIVMAEYPLSLTYTHKPKQNDLIYGC